MIDGAAEQEFAGRYRVISRLGTGGIGEVYRAEDSRGGGIVALKLLRTEWLSSPRERERFERESEVARRISHQNCARLIDAGEASGRPFVVYEFVPGTGLDEILKESRATRTGLDYGSVLRWGNQIAEALAAIHEAGLIHRDVKPGNIRITDDDRAVLLDFGLATGTGIDAVTRTGEFAGSLPYAPPEQIRLGAGAVDVRADVYSLAATLYECATTVPIHTGASIEQVVLSIIRDDPPPPSRLDVSLPRAFDLVIAHALEKEPALRYPTMRDFAADLNRLAVGGRVSARPRGIGRAIRDAIRKRPRLAAVVISVIVVSLVGPGALYLHESSTRRRLELEKARTRAAIDQADVNLGRALEAVDAILSGAAIPDLRGISGSMATQIALLDDACRRYEDLLRANPDDSAILFGHAHGLRRRAVIALRTGDFARAEEILERIVPVGRRLVERDPRSADYLIDLGDSLQARADLRATIGDRDGFEADVAEGIAALERAAELADDRAEPPRGIASLKNSLGMRRMARGEFEPAEVAFREAAAGMEHVIARTNSIEDYRSLAQTKNNLATLFSGTGRKADSIAALREVLEIQDRLLEFAKGDREVRLDRASSMQNLAVAYLETGRLDESIELSERIVEECERLLAEEPGSAAVEYLLAMSLTQLAGSYMRKGRHDECDATHDRAVATFTRLAGIEPAVPRYLANFGLALANRAIHHSQQKRVEEARTDFRRSLEQYDRALAIVPDDVAWSGLKEQIAGLAAKLPPEQPGESP